MNCTRGTFCIALITAGLILFVTIMLYTNVTNCLAAVKKSHNTCKASLLQEYMDYLSLRQTFIEDKIFRSIPEMDGSSLGNNSYVKSRGRYDISTSADTQGKNHSRDVKRESNQYIGATSVIHGQGSNGKVDLNLNLVPLSFNVTWSVDSSYEEVNCALEEICHSRVSTHECVVFMWITVSVLAAILLTTISLLSYVLYLEVIGKSSYKKNVQWI